MASTLVTLPREVIQRSGQRAPFDAERIRAALQRAGKATDEFDAAEAALLTAQVVKVLIDPADIVAGQVDEHRVFGEFFGVSQQIFRQLVVLLDCFAARPGAGDRSGRHTTNSITRCRRHSTVPNPCRSVSRITINKEDIRMKISSPEAQQEFNQYRNQEQALTFD